MPSNRSKIFPGPRRVLAGSAIICAIISCIAATPVKAQGVVPLDVVRELPQTPDNLASSVALMLVLDASGSMRKKLEGRTRMEVARSALREILPKLNHPRVHVGLRAYGFDSSVPKNKEASCPNTEMIRDIRVLDNASLQTAIDELDPYGFTPIGESLRQAGMDLGTVDVASRVVLLITDGAETCDGNPVQVARELYSGELTGHSVQTHIVGIDLNAETTEQMLAIADAGGGMYFSADTADELDQGLTDSLSLVHRFDSEWSISWVSGSTDAIDATTLESGLYALDTELQPDERRWFRVRTEPGKHIALRSLILDKSQTRASYTIGLYRPSGQAVAGREITVDSDATARGLVSLTDTTTENLLIGVGGSGERVNRGTLISLSVRDAPDITPGFEAPESERADTIELGNNVRYIAHLGDGDRADVYRIKPSNNASTLVVSTRFARAGFGHGIEILDQSGRTLKRTYGEGRGSLYLSIPRNQNELTLRIADRNQARASGVSSYSLIVAY